MQIKGTNPISNTFVEQETQPQAQPQPTTSLGIGSIKDAFEKPQTSSTILKMLSADYTGAGQPYTVSGTDLSWTDNPSFVGNPQAENPIEAVWEPDKVKAYLSEPLSPVGETKLQPPPKHEKEPERPSNS